MSFVCCFRSRKALWDCLLDFFGPSHVQSYHIWRKVPVCINVLYLHDSCDVIYYFINHSGASCCSHTTIYSMTQTKFDVNTFTNKPYLNLPLTIFELIATPDVFNNVLTLYSVSFPIKFIRFSCHKLAVTIEKFRRSQ